MMELSVIVPVYNEENCLPIFLKRLDKAINFTTNYEIILVIDPGTDKTEKLAMKYANQNRSIKLLIMSRKFGQPNAVLAGLENCSGKVVCVIDADLQDPPEIIPKLYNKLLEGYDVVSAKRSSRDGETFFKKLSTKFGYWLINITSEVKIPRDVGDFRIMTKKIVTYINKMNEQNGFLRGMVSYVGFKQTTYLYKRESRSAGDGKYNKYFGSMNIALNGLVGYSNFLLNITGLLGILIFFISLFGIFFILITKLSGWDYPLGYPTITVLIMMFGSFQLLSVAALGQYIGRIYNEVKSRPKFIIDKKINFNKQKIQK